MTALWDTAPCSLVEVDVSEVRNVPIIRVMNTFFPWRCDGSSTQALMPTYVSILRIPQMIWVWRATVEWYIDRGKPKNSEKKPVPVPLCPPQIPHGLTLVWTQASAVRGQRLTTWALARPFAPSCLTDARPLQSLAHFLTVFLRLIITPISPLGWLIPVFPADFLCMAYSSLWWWRQYTPETSVFFKRLHGTISKKAVIFILASMRTWNLTCPHQNISVATLPFKLHGSEGNTALVFWHQTSYYKMVTLVSLANIMGSGKVCTVLLEKDHLYIPYYEKQGPQNWLLWNSVFYCFPVWEKNSVCY
jgi:hypothetical protein